MFLLFKRSQFSIRIQHVDSRDRAFRFHSLKSFLNNYLIAFTMHKSEDVVKYIKFKVA